MTTKTERLPIAKAIICSPPLYIWCKEMFERHSVVIDRTMKKSEFYYFSPNKEARMVDTSTGLVYHYKGKHLQRIRYFQFLKIKYFWADT